jgi:hypothetical protein
MRSLVSINEPDTPVWPFASENSTTSLDNRESRRQGLPSLTFTRAGKLSQSEGAARRIWDFLPSRSDRIALRYSIDG